MELLLIIASLFCYVATVVTGLVLARAVMAAGEEFKYLAHRSRVITFMVLLLCVACWFLLFYNHLVLAGLLAISILLLSIMFFRDMADADDEYESLSPY